MTTVIINERTAKGKSLVQFLKKFEGEDFIYFGEEPNQDVIDAINDAKEEKLNSYKNSKELFASIKKKADV
jgi:hypothetical protein